MASIEMIKYHGQINSKNVVVKCERVCYRVGRMLGSKDKGWNIENNRATSYAQHVQLERAISC
jgi:hypothetical protein